MSQEQLNETYKELSRMGYKDSLEMFQRKLNNKRVIAFKSHDGFWNHFRFQ